MKSTIYEMPIQLVPDEIIERITGYKAGQRQHEVLTAKGIIHEYSEKSGKITLYQHHYDISKLGSKINLIIGKSDNDQYQDNSGFVAPQV